MVNNLSDALISLFIFIFICLVFSLFLIVLSYFLMVPKPDKHKLSAYECGFKPFTQINLPFEVHFYRIALLFLLFYV